MRLNSVILVLLVLLLPLMVFLAVVMLPTSLAATDTANITIGVNIVSACGIETSESYLNWTVSAGAVGTVQTFDIQNTGSQNITSISAMITDPETSRPYGQGSSNWEAGNLLVLHNSTESTYFFVDRREWNLSTIGSLTVDAGADSWGYFRNTTYNYPWSLAANTTLNTCNHTGTVLKVSNDNDDTDVTDETDICSTTIQTGASYATCYSNNPPLNGHCVLINLTCEFIHIYKFDYEGTFPSCTNKTYLYSGVLMPTQTETISANAWAPEGAPAGNLNNSTLMITATC